MERVKGWKKEIALFVQILIPDINLEILISVKKDIIMQDCLFLKNVIIKRKGYKKQSESWNFYLNNSVRQFFSGFNKCKCIQKQYDDGQSQVCFECHYSCLR
ncbi:unnamed protein product [Paramecium primaurelia]|uniref:Uncharacterized protein n=1 Tax=Paramecium primaurelia TaxID=5886 RepID=A0A8S1NXU0_PARPR|nr:unnamed protein product [Paramecium primaurelia]